MIQLESLNCLVRFKILGVVTVKIILFWHVLLYTVVASVMPCTVVASVMPCTVVASCHTTRCHMPDDRILETNSMELNS